MDSDIYSENLLDHYENPRNFGTLNSPTHAASDVNLICGDVITFQLKVENNIVRDIKFKSSGCAISKASASMLSEKIKNMKLDDLKKLRAETSAGVSDCRQALEDAKGDFEKAKKLIIERGLEKAAKKEGKETSQGIIESYIHTNGRVGVLVELRCETDFVGRTDEFKHLAHELALQVAAMNPKDIEALLKSEYIRDQKVTIADFIKQTVAKVGENITIARFSRMALGDND